MPLVGVKCDANGNEYSFTECIACARSGGPRRCDNPLPLLVAMSKNAEERSDAGISATMLLDCARKVILMREENYVEAPSKYWARFRGTIGHLMMEEYSSDIEDIIQEVRRSKTLTMDVNGKSVDIEITGKPDWYDVRRKLLIDFKSAKSINVKPIKEGAPKDGHEQQLNIYRWLLWGGRPSLGKGEDGKAVWGEPEYHEVKFAGLQYFDMAGTKKVAAKVWDLDVIEEYIRERLLPLATHKATGEMPPFWRNDKGYRHVLCGWCPLKDVCDARGE